MRLCPGWMTRFLQASRDFCCSESSPPSNPFPTDNFTSLLRSFLLGKKSPEKSLLKKGRKEERKKGRERKKERKEERKKGRERFLQQKADEKLAVHSGGFIRLIQLRN